MLFWWLRIRGALPQKQHKIQHLVLFFKRQVLQFFLNFKEKRHVSFLALQSKYMLYLLGHGMAWETVLNIPCFFVVYQILTIDPKSKIFVFLDYPHLLVGFPNGVHNGSLHTLLLHLVK